MPNAPSYADVIMVPATRTEAAEHDYVDKAAYFFFILLNATLFIRPAEIVEGWAELPIYNYVMVGCLFFSYPVILRKLRVEELLRAPTTLCLVGVLLMVVVSHLAHLFTWGARYFGIEYLKVLLYYLVLVSVIDSADRLRGFLRWLVLFNAAVSVLALLQYYEVIDIAALTAFAQKQIDPNTGELYVIPRLRGTGMFNDPNDLCLTLDVAFLAALYFFFDPDVPGGQLFWLPLLGLFGYSIVLTQSRGGMLALLVGLGAFSRVRFGWARTLPLVAAMVPLFALFLAQRNTALTISEDTAQDRLQLWSIGLTLFRQQPLFGIGAGQYEEQVGMVAHNSFVHCFTELGVVGGALFLGAFLAAGLPLYRLNRDPAPLADPQLDRLKPYLLAMLVAYTAGILTLSRSYNPTTYLVLGLVTAYLGLESEPETRPAFRFDAAFVRRLAVVSVCFLVGIYVYVRLFVRWA